MADKAVAKVCPLCKNTTWVSVPVEAYEAWQMGICIQKAWSDGSATDKEVLISGSCPKCQKETLEENEQG